MKIVRDLSTGKPERPSVLTLGVFDGLHLGHREIISKVVERAKQYEWVPTIITFDPHPRAVLQPESAPHLLQTLAQRLEGFEALGIEQVAVIQFSRAVASVEAEEFIQHYLFDRLDAQEIYLGSGATFGHNRRGNLAMLREACDRTGRLAVEVEEIRYHRQRISATRVRGLIRNGRVNPARKLLGRPYTIIGELAVDQGSAASSTSPIVYLNPLSEVLPAPGIYATGLMINGDRSPALTVVRYFPGRGHTVCTQIESQSVHHLAGEVTGRDARLGFFHRLGAGESIHPPQDLEFPGSGDLAKLRGWFARPAYLAALSTWAGW